MQAAKSKYFSLLVYPDNIPIDEANYLLSEELYLDYLLSPKHIDNIDEGKKEHYHLLLCFANPISINTIARVGERLKAPKKLFPVSNSIGAARYLVHADNPEKIQYKKEDIYIHGIQAHGLYNKAFSDNELHRVASTFRSIHNYIVDNNITDIRLLQTYLLNTDFSSFMLVQQNFKYFEMLVRTPLSMRTNVDDTINLD